tara:strand:+ start:75554 stop:77398 length:1845 start_codon:yes stop_codon:yes gene_type:complete
MSEEKVLGYINGLIENVPTDWLKLTTHRLDIYNEKLAKTEFLDQFEALYEKGIHDDSSLSNLPTAYDYIRLGHPLSSVLEFFLGKLNGVSADQVITFSSQTIPLLAVLRKNLFDNKKTLIAYTNDLPSLFDEETVKRVYGYSFEMKKVGSIDEISSFDGSVIYVNESADFENFELTSNIDFYVRMNEKLGSVLIINGEKNIEYVSAIQHVRRRETIAMTPADCFSALKIIAGKHANIDIKNDPKQNKQNVVDSIHEITATTSKALIGSCGLSVQYAIMMGLIDDANKHYPGKQIKIVVPPNCYGGTNDQARRVAACLENVDILDLPVDGDNDMVQSTAQVLDQVAAEDAVPLIIAEIPTNPRVEVPDLQALRDALSKERSTPAGNKAVDPVFILDQTFCPNVQFLSKTGILSPIRTISYVSGSKFPSGGKCTAGYCVANERAHDLMDPIEKHMKLCDNEATDLQVEILAEQMPSMLQRIKDAYKNTRKFVTFIEKTLPEAKINFVSEELAVDQFTPSVFSLDLPTKGDTHEEREAYKRRLNQKLIDMMITEIPNESKYCVSYGQLKGCYWTIPATSTQGTTKEDDKDYIARVSVSPDLDLEKHKEVFKKFVEEI